MRVDPALVVAAVAWLAIAAAPRPAQAAFVRIVDPAHPVVNDGKESGGGAWADLDGDGLPELFVAHGNLSDQVDALYANLGGGQFQRVVGGPMATDGGSSIGGTWGDYDGDGRLDLFVTNRGAFGNFLYHALGDTAFERILDAPVGTDRANANSSSWVDVDRDGDLDLMVVNFQRADDLYRNEGAPTFAFTAIDTGLVLGGTEFSIPGAWCDYDDDGDPDLFIGHAGSENDYLYVQTAPWTFTRTVLADARPTLGASWGDFDNDGDLDLFTASFVNQVSLLYGNAGPPTYALAPLAGTPFAADPGNAVGSAWGDFDNDADLDLFVARDGQDNLLFVNAGPPGYALARVDTLGVSGDGGASFGCSWVDLDADGDLDLFVANRSNQHDFLYRNDGPAGHSIRFRLQGVASNRAGIGARVRVRALVAGVPRWQVRDVEAQSGYNSQTLELHFGLADATVADSVVIAWPSGVRQVVTGLAADRAWTLVEGAGVVGVVPAPAAGAPGRLDCAVAPNPSRGRVGLVFEAGAPTAVTITLHDARGRRVAPVRHERLAAGRSRIDLGSPGLAAGVHFARVRAASGATVVRRFAIVD
jgi:hypothetical protein